MVKKAVKIGLAGLLFLIVLIVLTLLIASLVYSPEYVQRCVSRGESNVYDYQKSPNRTMQASPEPFFFRQGSGEDEACVRTLLKTILKVDDLDSFLKACGTQSFIVIQNDTILYERYFNGAKRDTVVTSFSVAKSFTSALVGIALAEGHIDSVNDPITKYLPELAARDERFSNITLRHLLMMSSGLRFTEYPFFTSDDALTYYYPDLRELALENTRIIEPSGRHFLYNDYNPQLLGLVLERTTGQNVTHYLQEKLWQPVGMEFDGSWSLDSDESGFELMQAGINARAIDFAKIGRLYMENGNWNGMQVVPTAWVAESTQEDRSIDRAAYYHQNDFFQGNEFGYYKYFWWGLHRDDGQYDFFAQGKNDQIIYVSPQADLIIVRNGEQDVPEGEEAIYQFASAMGENRKKADAGE